MQQKFFSYGPKAPNSDSRGDMKNASAVSMDLEE